MKDIAEETRLETSNFELDRPLPKAKNKRVIELIKDELGGQVMKEFVGLRAKTYSYLKNNNDKDGKSKRQKKCVIERKIKFQDYQNCFEAAQIEHKINQNKINVNSLKEWIKNNKQILKTQQRFKSERHKVFTEEINKIDLSSNYDKRTQLTDSIETSIQNE